MTRAVRSVVEVAFEAVVVVALEAVPTPLVVVCAGEGGWGVLWANRAAVRRFGDAVRPRRLPWNATPEHDPAGVQLACADLAAGRATTCLLEIEIAGSAPTALELLPLETDRPVVLARVVESARSTSHVPHEGTQAQLEEDPK